MLRYDSGEDLILALALQPHPVIFEVLWLVVARSDARVVTSGDIASGTVGRYFRHHDRCFGAFSDNLCRSTHPSSDHVLSATD